MLRDTFPKSKFESKDGGYTAIIAKKVVLPVIVTAVVSAAIYIIILIVVGSEYVKYCTCLDDSDPGLYNLNKCDNITSRAWKFNAPYNATPEIYNELCLEPGKMSNSGMNGGWAMEGALRVSMLVGLVFGAAGVLYATFALPETLRPTHQTTTMSEYFQSKKHLILKPYANVGTLLNSTPLLKVVITALAFNWCGSGFASISASPLLRMRYGITSAQYVFFLNFLCERPEPQRKTFLFFANFFLTNFFIFFIILYIFQVVISCLVGWCCLLFYFVLFAIVY